MFLWTAPNPDRDGDMDNSIVVHEYTHGISNRYTGGPATTSCLGNSEQGGEGWSDYFALTIQNCLALMQNPEAAEKTVTGDWVVNRSRGIRLAPYNDDYPGKYGDVGAPPYNEEHAVGEIWCAALMKINRDFGTALGNKVKGHRIVWQVVVDGLKLTPANPSFLDARDAILHALEDLRNTDALPHDQFKKLNRAAWHAFAHFGMGPIASSIGATLEGIVADTVPPQNI